MRNSTACIIVGFSNWKSQTEKVTMNTCLIEQNKVQIFSMAASDSAADGKVY